MPCPEFYNFIRPALAAVARQQDLHWREVAEHAARALSLTGADREETVASGAKTKFEDRVHWALTYLRGAKLIESSGRGTNRITERGIEYLGRAPAVIKPADLAEFPEFREFNRPRASSGARIEALALDIPVNLTPLESMEQSHLALREELASTILMQLKDVSPSRFERIIVDLMLSLGYGGPQEDAGQTLGRSGDGGVDGVIRQDRLGLDNIYLQAKRYADRTVGTEEVNAFIGALTTRGTAKGVLITTSGFSEPARRIAQTNPHLKLSLIDGRELARLMIDHNLGVAVQSRYEVKRVDSDYFAEE